MPILNTLLSQIDTELVAAKAAQLQVLGVGANKQVQVLSEQFGYQFTRSQVKRLELKDTYQRVLKEHTESVIKQAVIELKKGTSLLVPKIIEALNKALSDGDIRAILPALKILGIENAVDDTKQSQTITVVLPGSVNHNDVGLGIIAQKEIPVNEKL